MYFIALPVTFLAKGDIILSVFAELCKNELTFVIKQDIVELEELLEYIIVL